MNKKELVNRVSERCKIAKKDVEAVYNALLETVVEVGTEVKAEMKTAGKEDGAVDLPGFGKVKIKHKAAYTGRNPKTKEEIQIPEGYRVTCTIGNTIKNKLK